MTKHPNFASGRVPDITRREFVAAASSAAVLGTLPLSSLAQAAMPQRRIPSTGEMLPVVGLGSSKVVQEIAQKGEGPVAAVLRTLVQHGGKLVDTWPRNPANDAGLGSVLAMPEFRDKLFVTTKVDQVGKEAGIKQFRDAQQSYRREVIAGCQPLLSKHFNLTVELPLKAIVRGYSYTVVPINWYNRTTGVSKLKIKEMGSRYLFIVLYVWLERYLSRGDYVRSSAGGA